MEERRLRACHCCGLIQVIPTLGQGERALCVRCATTVHRDRSTKHRNQLAFACALSGLILFPLAILLPMMTIEKFGHRSEASIGSGSLGLLADGQWFVGGVVLVASLILPFLKLVGLMVISGFSAALGRTHRAWTYRVIEWAGRWGMLDVLLLSVLVAWVKIGDLVDVRAGPAALAFTGCVLFSLVASALFDPHAIWSEAEEVAP